MSNNITIEPASGRAFSVVQSPATDRETKIARVSSSVINDFSEGLVFVHAMNGKKTVCSISAGAINDGIVMLPVMIRKSIGIDTGDDVIVEPCKTKPRIINSKVIIEVVNAENTGNPIPAEVLKSIGTRFLRNYKGGVPLVNGDLFSVSFPNNNWLVDVKINLPEGIWKLGAKAEIDVLDKQNVSSIATVGWEDIGGLDDTIKDVRFYVELPLKHPEIFKKRYHKDPPRGILLKGPPGCGKTLLVKVIANECNANFIMKTPADIFDMMLGNSEKNVKAMFDDARQKVPCILFIDEIDALSTKRDDNISSSENRVVSQLLNEMDGLKDLGQIIVIGATNRQNALDAAARRPGRFEKEIEIPPPDEEGRKQILKIHLRNVPTLMNDDETGSLVDIDEIARITHGYVGADIAGLVREGVLSNLKRNIPNIDLTLPVIPDDPLEILNVSQEDLLSAMDEIIPSALRSFQIEVPHVTWDQVGGLEDVKQKLIETVIWNTEKKESVKALGIRLPRGILLYGPPGTGKTLLAKAVATESKCNFISVKGPEFLSKWVGESERAIRELFGTAKRARPCIVFMDEADAVVPVRSATDDSGTRVTERIVSQLLTELDGVEERKDVILIMSTNRPDMIDPAILRKGRIDRMILVPAPDADARAKIFQVHLQGKKLDPTIKIDDISKRMAEKTENFSGSDIEELIMEAGIIALNADKDSISADDIEKAVNAAHPSLDDKITDAYKKLEGDLNKKITKARGLSYMT